MKGLVCYSNRNFLKSINTLFLSKFDLFAQVILLLASVTLCQAAPKRKSHKRGVQYDEYGTSNFQNPSQLDTWHPQQFDSHHIESDTSNDDDDEDDDSFDHSSQQHQQQQQHQQSFDELGSWEDEKSSNPKPDWNSASPWSSNSNAGWSGLGGAVKSKTIIKKIPVPYERPIKIDNPIYTPVEKHIPIERPIPIVKWVEKRIPLYVDHPVAAPIVKEEHVPQPYDQKVRVILQKVYVHVPAPPVKQTIIIRKKLARRSSHNNKRRKNLFGWI